MSKNSQIVSCSVGSLNCEMLVILVWTTDNDCKHLLTFRSNDRERESNWGEAILLGLGIKKSLLVTYKRSLVLFGYSCFMLRCVLDTTLFDKVCQWLAEGRWFSLCTPVSSTNNWPPWYHWNIVESGVKTP